ncbi:glycosyltransferase family 2 protein [Roseofilum capinflatum]|uniref:Glycosyltransferase n=1 Tax=Roseofilum capinflatum BLCC-M114 TaxID=3022440 RepID=A0ABT7B0N1_9CYAN|nr:glycosyltransferase [Roseofilum capinflatum]MDJ1172691.1 glycosyltransferase [Roseofilum capinflatum BLCC-M114]
MSNPQVTIVVVPRERFSYTQKSLESIYQNTHFPFNLVYVDGNSPSPYKTYLEQQAREKQFKLIRTDHFLAPNQARNLGLAEVKTKYLVFIDNDVLVKPGWLENLVNTAENTGAWLVGPLTLIGDDFKTIHIAGGTIELREKNGKRSMIQKRPFMTRPLAEFESQIKPGATELLEFHCMLTRREVFDSFGPLDEQFMNMCEEDDLCMEVANAGHLIYLEPSAVVSYVAPSPSEFAWSDLPFFFIRWSDSWCKISVEHCREKWNLADDAVFPKHTEKFVRDHRFLVIPRPKKLAGYFLYGLKRVMLLGLLKPIMDWRALQLPRNPGQNLYST